MSEQHDGPSMAPERKPHPMREDVARRCAVNFRYWLARTTMQQLPPWQLMQEDMRQRFLEEADRILSLFDAPASGEPSGAHDVLRRLIEWADKYPSSRVYPHDMAQMVTASLDAVVDAARKVVAGEPLGTAGELLDALVDLRDVAITLSNGDEDDFAVMNTAEVVLRKHGRLPTAPGHSGGRSE